MHDLRRVSDHHCLHYVLLHLNEDWRGLHVMVVIYLRKYWTPKTTTHCLPNDDLQYGRECANCRTTSQAPPGRPPFYLLLQGLN